MSTHLFESALGIKAPWSVGSVVEFDETSKRLQIDFEVGTRFAFNRHIGKHPAVSVPEPTSAALIAAAFGAWAAVRRRRPV